MRPDPLSLSPPRVVSVISPPDVGRLGANVASTPVLVAGIAMIAMSFLVGVSLPLFSSLFGSETVLQLFFVALVVALGVPGAALLIGVARRRRSREARFRRAAARVMKRPVSDREQTITRLVRRCWSLRGVCPDPRLVVQLIDEYLGRDSTRAELVTLGDGVMQAPSQARFEPVVLKAGRLLHTHRRIFNVVWGVLAFPAGVLWVSTCSMGNNYGIVAFAFIMSFIGPISGGGGVQWFWQHVACPTYLRVAPGVVQVLRFRCFRQRPSTIRDYRMVPGTIVVLAPPMMVKVPQEEGRDLMGAHDAPAGEAAWWRVVLDNGKCQDRIDLAKATAQWETARTIQRALVSTARIPSMSQSTLLG